MKMMRLARKTMPKVEARLWDYGELDRMYPPAEKPPLAGSEQSQIPPMAGSDGIQGLSDLPDDWPDLPANASMSTEITWVRANRLRIVEERPGRRR